MASPPLRRQISPPSPSPSQPPTTTSSQTPPPTTTSTTSGGLGGIPIISSIFSDISSILNPPRPSESSLSPSTSSLQPTSTSSPSTTSSVPSLPPGSTPPLSTTPGGQITVTETTSTTAPSSTGTSKGTSFLQNKPLAGFVFGLAGLAGLVIVVIALAAFIRRHNRKRLLADASKFTFDPKGVDDRMADENHSSSGLIGYHSSGHGHNDYASGNGAAGSFNGVGVGVSRSGLSLPPPMPTYLPQNYASHDGAYPPQYHSLSNISVGHTPPPNPYEMHSLGNDRRYSSGPSRHDSYYTSGLSGDHPLATDSGHLVPRQLQPGLRPAQGPTFAHNLSASPPPLNSSPSISSTTWPSHTPLQPSASDQDAIPRLPTPGALPNTFGQRNSIDDDAYGGAFLGPESPPGPRTLQVANM